MELVSGVASGLALAVVADPAWVAVTPALLVGSVESGLDCLDLACVVLDVQRRGADGGVGIFLQPFHLAAEPLVERESGGTRADAVQCPGPGPRVGRPQQGEHRAGIGRGAAPPSCPLRHGRTLGPAPRRREAFTARPGTVARCLPGPPGGCHVVRATRRVIEESAR